MATIEEIRAELAQRQGGPSAEQIRAELARRQQPQVDSNRGNFGQLAGQGLLFGFGDEFAGLSTAAMNSAANLFGQGRPESFSETYRIARDMNRGDVDAFRERNPGTALAAEVGGGLLTGGVGLAKTGAVKGGQGLLKAAGIGAGQGGLYGAGNAEELSDVVSEAAKGSLIGGAVGAAVPAVARGASNLLRRAQPVANEAADTLTAAGVPLSTAQQAGSRSGQALENSLKEIPFVGRPLQRLAQDQREAFQSRLMGMAGFADDDIARGIVDDDAILRASDKFGQRYSEALGGQKLALTDDMITEMVSAGEDAVQVIDQPKVEKIIASVFDKFDDNGELSGKAYQKIRSELGRKAFRMRVGNPEHAALYRSMRDTLDNAVEQMAPGKLGPIRQEYARFKQIEGAFQSSNSAEGAEGLLRLSALSGRSKKQGNALKDREWRELIQSASAVLPDKVANSGTAQRYATLQGITSLLGLGGTGSLFGGPLGAAASLVGGRGATEALSRGVGSSLLRAPATAANRAGNLLFPAGQVNSGLLVNPFLLSQQP